MRSDRVIIDFPQTGGSPQSRKLPNSSLLTLLFGSCADLCKLGERTNLAWADETAGFYYAVVDAMLETGFTPDEIGKIGGGNYLRIFGEAIGK
jgi:microsomal dipeptidase-like Zn-dependent dipeptidase